MKRLENSFFSAAVKASAFIVAAMFAFSACQPKEEVVDPKVSVSQSEITSEAAGASFDVTVTSNVAWVAEIENNDKWVTVEPAEGEAGEAKVTVTVKKNNGDNARDTKITFKAETATAQVTVNQFGKDNIAIDKTAYEATPAGGTDAVKVTTNNNWTATVSEGASWVTVAPASGEAGEATATVTVDPYEGAEDRTAKVTFAAGDAKMDYTVTQKGVSVVLSQSSWSVESAGAEATVTVTANAAWTAASSAEWVTVEPASGAAGETVVTVTAEKNLVEEARNATVTFTANENVKAEYAVSQAAMAPVVLKDQYAYTAAGAEVLPVDIKSKFITFDGNDIWGVLAPEEGVTSETVETAGEYVMFYVAESAIATLLGGQTNEVDLTAVPEGAIEIGLIRNEEAVVEFTKAADITSGTIKFNVSATDVVIDIEMVMPDNSKFLANTSFAPEAFVKPVGTVKIEVPSKTATKADLVLTPDPLEGFTYYWEVLPKATADIMLPTDQDIIQYLVNYVDELIAKYPDRYTWTNLIDEGVVEYKYTGLDPLTEYYVVAFGADAEGNVTTGLFKTTFTTEDLNPALKEWMGTWNVTSEQTWDKSKETPGLTDTPSERTITIGTSSVFDLEVDEETDLIVAGLSYTDGMPLFNGGLQLETVGSVNKNGNLELKNGLEAYEATGTGIFTWVGYCWSEAMQGYYVVSGNYPPYTLALGTDKVSGTGTPYSGVLSNQADFTVTYYDMFIYDDAGGISSYYGTSGYGALAGKWTLTKVEETPSAAPKSAKKIMTRFEKEIKVQEAKLMQNLNSSYLFKAAQAR